MVFFARKSAAYMEDSDHQYDKGVAPSGAEFVPVGGNEERHATGEKDSAENQGDSALPSHPSTLGFLRAVVRADC